MLLSQLGGAVGAVMVIVLLVGMGYALTHYKKLTEPVAGFISWFVINVTLPAYMIYYMYTSFSKQEALHFPQYVGIPLLSVLVGYVAGAILASLLKVPQNRRGIMIVLCAQNNTIFMGLPVNIAFFGEQSIPYVLYYYMANTLLFWTLGSFVMSPKSQKPSISCSVKNMITPPLISIFVGIPMLLAGVSLPGFLLDTLKYIGSMTTPLSMMFIGYILGKAGLSHIRLGRDVIFGNLLRFGVGPGLALLVYAFFPMQQMMHDVFIVQAFMPVMANQVILAQEKGGDSEFAAVMVSSSTLLSLVLLPVVKMLL